MGSGLSRDEVTGHMRDLVEGLFRNIPSGIGSHRKDLRLSQHELKRVLQRGAGWAVAQGYGTARDLEHIEENGCLQGAQPDLVQQSGGPVELIPLQSPYLIGLEPRNDHAGSKLTAYRLANLGRRESLSQVAWKEIAPEIQFVEGLYGAHFKVSNPNAKNTCGCGNSFAIE